jgi:hypothetical protein
MDDGFSVTLAGNGPLLAANVAEAKDLPPRVLIDFTASRRVPRRRSPTSGMTTSTRFASPPTAREPLITRVVIDLARKLPYTVEQIGEDLRVMFRRAVDTAAAAITPVHDDSKSPSPRRRCRNARRAGCCCCHHRAGDRARASRPADDGGRDGRRCPTHQPAPLPVPMPRDRRAMQQPTLPPMSGHRQRQRQFTGDP